MCGLTGFLGRNQYPNEILKRMTQAISHRGPDSEGFWSDEVAGIAFGHRRLAIVDLSPAGQQPMCSAIGRYVMAFNGEIYNHLALRADLEREGAQFSWRGHSDTETLLTCFEAWGVKETLKRSVGMFAIALWDRYGQKLTLARDRFGEKPLYYGWQGFGDKAVFLFGSELKALGKHPAFEREVDRQVLASFLQFGNVPGSDSIYKGIRKVPPGTLMSVSLADPEPVAEVYWSATDSALRNIENPFQGTPEDAIDALEASLKKAVSEQMVADVPLGAFLSGGVDSSTIVAMMQSLSSQPVKTFSIGFGEERYNEAAYAKAVATHLGTEHRELYVSPQEALAIIPLLPNLYDEPFADVSQIPTYLVSRMARQHVTVSLSGDAGDELFAGYNRYRFTARRWQSLKKMPRPLRKLAAVSISGISEDSWDALGDMLPVRKRFANLGRKLHKAASVLEAGSEAELYWGVRSHWSDAAACVLGASQHKIPSGEVNPALKALSATEQMMLMDTLSYLPDDILTKVDRAAMGVSLETRVPFLDHRLFEFAWQLPLAYKLRPEAAGYTTKWVLRQLLDRYVPSSLIDRPKMGFAVPMHSWLRGPLRDWAEALLDPERLKVEGFFRPEPIRRLWQEHLCGRRNWSERLWSILMFQAWHERERLI